EISVHGLDDCRALKTSVNFLLVETYRRSFLAALQLRLQRRCASALTAPLAARQALREVRLRQKLYAEAFRAARRRQSRRSPDSRQYRLRISLPEAPEVVAAAAAADAAATTFSVKYG